MNPSISLLLLSSLAAVSLSSPAPFDLAFGGVYDGAEAQSYFANRFGSGFFASLVSLKINWVLGKDSMWKYVFLCVFRLPSSAAPAPPPPAEAAPAASLPPRGTPPPSAAAPAAPTAAPPSSHDGSSRRRCRSSRRGRAPRCSSATR